MGVRIATYAATLGISAALAQAAIAETVVGSNYTEAKFTSSKLLFDPLANSAGLHLRTIIMACANNTWLSIVMPATPSKKFAACNPNSFNIQGVVNVQDIYVPAGWGVKVFTGGISPGSTNQIHITYDYDLVPGRSGQ